MRELTAYVLITLLAGAFMVSQVEASSLQEDVTGCELGGRAVREFHGLAQNYDELGMRVYQDNIDASLESEGVSADNRRLLRILAAYGWFKKDVPVGQAETDFVSGCLDQVEQNYIKAERRKREQWKSL